MTFPPPQQPGDSDQEQPAQRLPSFAYQVGQHGGNRQHIPQYLPPEAGPRYARYDPDTPVRVLAGPGRRLVARLIDMLILFAVFAGLVWLNIGVITSTGDPQNGVSGVLISLMILVWLLYEPLFNTTKGGTPGKLTMGIRVVRVASAEYPGFGVALGRFLIAPVMSIIPFGGLLNVLWCCWDRPLYQCLHDKVAGTVVVHKEGEASHYGNV